jgi:DNA-directed RNA polymerase specialized sigma54-like protein
MQDVAQRFRVHYSTVSRAVTEFEESKRGMPDCKT